MKKRTKGLLGEMCGQEVDKETADGVLQGDLGAFAEWLIPQENLAQKSGGLRGGKVIILPVKTLLRALFTQVIIIFKGVKLVMTCIRVTKRRKKRNGLASTKAKEEHPSQIP